VNKRGIYQYFDRMVHMEFPKDEQNELETGNVLLTRAGRDIARIATAQPIAGFREYVIARWRASGITITEIDPFPVPPRTPTGEESQQAEKTEVKG
jgi:hypothetical protein